MKDSLVFRGKRLEICRACLRHQNRNGPKWHRLAACSGLAIGSKLPGCRLGTRRRGSDRTHHLLLAFPCISAHPRERLQDVSESLFSRIFVNDIRDCSAACGLLCSSSSQFVHSFWVPTIEVRVNDAVACDDPAMKCRSRSGELLRGQSDDFFRFFFDLNYQLLGFFWALARFSKSINCPESAGLCDSPWLPLHGNQIASSSPSEDNAQ